MTTHILFYLHRFPGYGGIEKLTILYANYYVDILNWKVSIISFDNPNDQKLNDQLNREIQVYQVPEPKNLNSNVNLNFIHNFLKINKISIILFQDSYANIHSNLFDANKHLNIPLITIEHNSPMAALASLKNQFNNLSLFKTPKETIIKILYPYYKWKLVKSEKQRRQIKYQNSSRYILLSEYFFKEFIFVSKIKIPKKLLSINNPITINFKIHEKNLKKKQLLFVGRIESAKNVLLLIKIWQQLYKEFVDWEFIIVGDGTDRARTEKYINTNNIERVVFKGFYYDVVPFYSEASIFCMASLYEGWGLTLTESMSMGVIPVVFNTFASLKDIVEDGKTGFIAEPWDVENYISILKRLMNDEEKRIEISNQAKESISRFEFKKIVNLWVELINQELNNSTEFYKKNN